jgi:hypothetical protein
MMMMTIWSTTNSLLWMTTMMENIPNTFPTPCAKPFANLLYHSPTNSIMQPLNFLTSSTFVHKLQNFHTSYNPQCATSINSKTFLAQLYNVSMHTQTNYMKLKQCKQSWKPHIGNFNNWQLFLIHTMFKPFCAINVPPNMFSNCNELVNFLILVYLPYMFGTSSLFSSALHLFHQLMVANFTITHLQ